MAFGFTYTLPTITGSHTDFPVVLKTADFPAGAIDTGGNAFDNGGGNLRAYTDSGKGTQLSVEVVRLVVGASPDAEVWVKLPTAATSNTIYLEADAVATVQPDTGAAFGRDSVWTQFLYASHDGGTDATGGMTPTISGTSLVGGPFGGGNSARRYSSSSDLITNPVGTISEPFTISIIAKVDSTSSNRLFGVGNSGATDSQVTLKTQFSGTVALELSATNGGEAQPISGDAADRTIGTWRHYALRATSASSRTLLLNGGDKTSLSTTTYSPTATADRCVIGASADSTPFSGGHPFDIAEARVALTDLGSDWLATEHDNQSAVTAWGTVGAWADTGGSDALLADDLESSTEVSAPIIGQVHALTADDLQSISTVSSPTLTAVAGVDALLADDLESISTLSTPTLDRATTAINLESGTITVASLTAIMTATTATETITATSATEVFSWQ